MKRASFSVRFVATLFSVASVLTAWGCTPTEKIPRDVGDPVDVPWQPGEWPARPSSVDHPTAIDIARSELGRLLFYDPVLSRDGKVACASCHSELWGMGDGLALSVGVDGEGAVGPGRTGPNLTRRNAMSLWNVGFRSTLFWDGRSPTLEDQASQPLDSPVEFDREVGPLVAELRANDTYRMLFTAAFPEVGANYGITEMTVALASFEQGLITQGAPYDQLFAGDDGAIDDETRAGMELFADFGCHGCHRPPLFGDADRFVQRRPILAGEDADLGRFDVTGDSADRGAFGVPNLRNVRETGPYFHDGAVATLAEAVRSEVEASGLSATERERDLIERFLNKALIDRSQEPDRPETVPSGLPVPLDSFRVGR